MIQTPLLSEKVFAGGKEATSDSRTTAITPVTVGIQESPNWYIIKMPEPKSKTFLALDPSGNSAQLVSIQFLKQILIKQ